MKSAFIFSCVLLLTNLHAEDGGTEEEFIFFDEPNLEPDELITEYPVEDEQEDLFESIAAIQETLALPDLIVEAPVSSDWCLIKDVAPFSYKAEFALKQGGLPLGTVVRTGLFTPRYYYDLYDADGFFQVRGITRVLSLGLLFAGGMEIDLYDADDDWIGMIQGRVFSHSRAKFSLYNEWGILAANAYLNDESSNFLIVSAQNEEGVLAELSGKVYGDASVWEMKGLNTALNLDERVLQVFTGFVADYQASFIRPPQKEVYYYYESKRGN